MFRSLHIKLVMIMLLLVTSLMAVVGAFLMTSVTSFYIDDFYAQMSETFGESNASFVHALRSEATQADGAQRIQTMIETYSGTLGIDGRNRNYYILDARTGDFLAGSDEDGGENLELTENILTARNGNVGDQSDISANYMDVAIPISGGDNSFIIYIRDNRSTVSSLNSELLLIILQALLVGLLVSVMLSFVLAKTMIDPIEKLTEGALIFGAGVSMSDLFSLTPKTVNIKNKGARMQTAKATLPNPLFAPPPMAFSPTVNIGMHTEATRPPIPAKRVALDVILLRISPSSERAGTIPQ